MFDEYETVRSWIIDINGDVVFSIELVRVKHQSINCEIKQNTKKKNKNGFSHTNSNRGIKRSFKE